MTILNKNTHIIYAITALLLCVLFVSPAAKAQLKQYKYTAVIDNDGISNGIPLLFNAGQTVTLSLSFDHTLWQFQQSSGSTDQYEITDTNSVLILNDGNTNYTFDYPLVVSSSYNWYSFHHYAVDFSEYIAFRFSNGDQTFTPPYDAPQYLNPFASYGSARFNIYKNGKHSSGYVTSEVVLQTPTLACQSGASYPQSWSSAAACDNKGCDFGDVEQSQCEIIASNLGALQMTFQNNVNAANVCRLHTRCTNLQPDSSFVFKQRELAANEYILALSLQTSSIQYGDSDGDMWLQYEGNNNQTRRFMAATWHIDDYELAPGQYRYFVKINADDFPKGTFTDTLNGKWQWQTASHDGYMASEFKLEELDHTGRPTGCVDLAGMTFYWVDFDNVSGDLVSVPNGYGSTVVMKTTPWIEDNQATSCTP